MNDFDNPMVQCQVYFKKKLVVYTKYNIMELLLRMGIRSKDLLPIANGFFEKVCTKLEWKQFESILHKSICEYAENPNHLYHPKSLLPLTIANDIHQHRSSYIVLLGGTSGTGKSTLASLLATKLGISTILSTDSIRHVLRSVTDKKNHPTLFKSTYQAGECIPSTSMEHLGSTSMKHLESTSMEHLGSTSIEHLGSTSMEDLVSSKGTELSSKNESISSKNESLSSKSEHGLGHNKCNMKLDTKDDTHGGCKEDGKEGTCEISGSEDAGLKSYGLLKVEEDLNMEMNDLHGRLNDSDGNFKGERDFSKGTSGVHEMEKGGGGVSTSMAQVLNTSMEKDSNTVESRKVGLSKLEKQNVIKGYKLQSKLVFERLEEIVTKIEKEGRSIIIEGVHLMMDEMVGFLKRHDTCIPFMVYISNPDKHRERFALRAKCMTMDPSENKYIYYFENIRNIQNHLCKSADKILIPKVDNTNVDRSVATIHATMMRVLIERAKGKKLVDTELNKVILLSKAHEAARKHAWSSKAMKKAMRPYLRQKVSKRILLRRLLAQSNVISPNESSSDDSEEQDSIEDEEQTTIVPSLMSENEMTTGSNMEYHNLAEKSKLKRQHSLSMALHQATLWREGIAPSTDNFTHSTENQNLMEHDFDSTKSDSLIHHDDSSEITIMLKDEWKKRDRQLSHELPCLPRPAHISFIGSLDSDQEATLDNGKEDELNARDIELICSPTLANDSKF